MPANNAQTAKSTFKKIFLSDASHTFTAPGRVNIIGEHTDYNDGFVLPCAIRFNTVIACRPNGTNKIRMVAADFDNQMDEFVISHPVPHSEYHWANYLRGVVSEFLADGHRLMGMDLVVAGDIPKGTGLSSSASLEVCFSYALNELFALGLSRKELAKLSQRAENHFVGCHCGIMDQLISACGEKNSALLIDCRDFSTKAVQIPKSLDLVIINPNVERNLVGSEYNVRRASCEIAARTMGVDALRDADLALLEAHKDTLDDTHYRRARHIITENARVKELIDAFNKHDLQAVHDTLAASHASMKDDFEITTPELDFVADTLNTWLSNAGGARMTGGGFGGCAIALIPKEQTAELCPRLITQYRETYGKPMDIYVAEICDGARTLNTLNKNVDLEYV